MQAVPDAEPSSRGGENAQAAHFAYHMSSNANAALVTSGQTKGVVGLGRGPDTFSAKLHQEKIPPNYAVKSKQPFETSEHRV